MLPGCAAPGASVYSGAAKGAGVPEKSNAPFILANFIEFPISLKLPGEVLLSKFAENATNCKLATSGIIDAILGAPVMPAELAAAPTTADPITAVTPITPTAFAAASIPS